MSTQQRPYLSFHSVLFISMLTSTVILYAVCALHMRVAYLHVLSGCQGRASCSCDNYSDRTVKSLSFFLPVFSEGVLLRKPCIIFSSLRSTHLPFVNGLDTNWGPKHQ